MKNSLLIESTVLEIKSLFPYYTESYIRESMREEPGAEEYSQFNKYLSKQKKSFLSVLKSKGKEVFKKAKQVIKKTFLRVLKANTYILGFALIISSFHSTVAINYNKNLDNKFLEIKILTEVDINTLNEKDRKNHINNLAEKVIDYMEHYNKLAETGAETFKFFGQRFLNAREENINSVRDLLEAQIGEGLIKFVGIQQILAITADSIIKSMNGENTVPTIVNDILDQKKKLINDEIEKLNSFIKEKDSSNEEVIRSYIKNVILESKV